MNKIINFLDLFVSKFWYIFCIIIFSAGIIIKAEYNFFDFPYFSLNKSIDLILTLLILVLYIKLFQKSDWIEQHIKTWVLWLGFGLIGVLFVFLVPIKPFSDMSHVTEGALLFANMDIEGILSSDYLQFIAKNLKVSLFYGIFAMFLPKNVLSLRILNVLLYLLISHFLGKIGNNLGIKHSKLIFIISATYMPLILYCNHVYFDLPTLLMCVLAFYFYTKEHNFKSILLSGIFLGIGCSLRVLAYLVVIALAIDYIFKNHKVLFTNKFKKLGIIITFILCTLCIPKLYDVTVDTHFRTESAPNESIWNLFWMGINEQEFGFMHNEIATGETRDFKEFYDLLTSRTPKQNVALFGRKIFWTWSQGTYQSQRYAFGSEAETEPEKFIYETPATGLLMKDEFILRQFINMFCRAQYMALFLLMIIGLHKISKEDREQYRPFIYLMFGTFLILIFYEMKSRYVLHCFISMLMLAMLGLKKIGGHIDHR